MGVLDALKAEVYSNESLKTYEIIRTTEPLLKPYPTLKSFLEMMWAPGSDAAKNKDQYLILLIRLVQERSHAEIIQSWLLYLFRPKLKILRAKYPQVDESDSIWVLLRVVNEFKLWKGRQFVAQRISKNMENAFLRISRKVAEKQEVMFIDTRRIKSGEEPFILPDQILEMEVPETKKLIQMMNNLSVSKNVQFILLKQLEGKTLYEIAEILNKKYDSVQKALSREKQRLKGLQKKNHQKK